MSAMMISGLKYALMLSSKIEFNISPVQVLVKPKKLSGLSTPYADKRWRVETVGNLSFTFAPRAVDQASSTTTLIQRIEQM